MPPPNDALLTRPGREGSTAKASAFASGCSGTAAPIPQTNAHVSAKAHVVAMSHAPNAAAHTAEENISAALRDNLAKKRAECSGQEPAEETSIRERRTQRHQYGLCRLRLCCMGKRRRHGEHSERRQKDGNGRNPERRSPRHRRRRPECHDDRRENVAERGEECPAREPSCRNARSEARAQKRAPIAPETSTVLALQLSMPLRSNCCARPLASSYE